MEKRTVLFCLLVVISVITILYCFFSDLIPSVKKVAESDKTVTNLMEQNREALGIANELGEFVAGNTNMLLPHNPETAESDTSLNNSTLKYDATGTFQSVVDGSTYIIKIDDTDTTVSLIGVSFDESSENDIIVSEIVKAYLNQGDTVHLEYDVGRTDPNGNTLAYVYFSNGTMIQRWLLSNGYAFATPIQPNSKYAAQFESLEQKAKENNIGLWAYMENPE